VGFSYTLVRATSVEAAHRGTDFLKSGRVPHGKGSNSQHFWRVSRVESTLLDRIIILLPPLRHGVLSHAGTCREKKTIIQDLKEASTQHLHISGCIARELADLFHKGFYPGKPIFLSFDGNEHYYTIRFY
jgi:hypothetical protein